MNRLKQLNQQYIGGNWKDGSSDKTFEDKNPYNNEVICTFKLANKDDLNEAYEAAKAAQPGWEKVNPYGKRALLDKVIEVIDANKDDIVDLIIDELGGTRLKAEFEIGLAKDFIKEASSHPMQMTGEIIPSPVDGKENRLYRRAAGVIAVISPSNFPLILGLKSVASAIATGNSVVLKPHEDTAILGGTLIAKIFEEAGLPKGVLNVIVTEISEIGDAFVAHPIPQVVSFTGSVGVGSKIAEIAGKHLKKVILELGGNSALMILEDADLEQAVNASVFSRFIHQGQVCMSANRILVHNSLYQDFIEQYKNRVSNLKVGDPRDPDTVIGPLINSTQASTIKGLIDKGISEGAKAITGGQVKGNVVEPTVFVDVEPDMEIAQNELFGPLVCVIPFDTEEEGIAIMNNTTFGLSGAIHTKDIYRGTEIAKQINSAAVHVNDGTINDEPAVAFGGEGNSGIGRLNGKWSIDNFTRLQWISVQHTKRMYPI